MGIEKFPDTFQERISLLLTKNNNGELTDEEKHELNEMMEKWRLKNLENARRIVKNTRIPKAKRIEAELREARAQQILSNLTDSKNKTRLTRNWQLEKLGGAERQRRKACLC